MLHKRSVTLNHFHCGAIKTCDWTEQRPRRKQGQTPVQQLQHKVKVQSWRSPLTPLGNIYAEMWHHHLNDDQSGVLRAY